MPNYNYILGNIKPLKVRAPRIPRIHHTKMGDRTLTPARKRKLKEAVRFRCEKCGKKRDARLLEIHHKKSISSHKSRYGVNLPVYSIGRKLKPVYDNDDNLQVICIYCHDKTKKRKKTIQSRMPRLL